MLGDDHRMFLDSLGRSLAPRFDIVAAMTDGESLIRAARELEPDIIVLDLAMPSPNGLEVSRELLEHDPSQRIIMLTMHADLHLAAAVLEAGVAGFLIKTETIDTLESAVFHVFEGRRFVSRSIEQRGLHQLLDGHGSTVRPARFDLTSRQKEVLVLLAEGLASKVIAARLGVSIKTVEFHKYSMMERLGIGTSADLVRYAFMLGLSPAGVA